MSDNAEDIKKQIEQLQERLKEVEDEEDSLEKQRLEDFRKLGTLMKTRNFFAAYRKGFNDFNLYILKEGKSEANEDNAEKVFQINFEDVTERFLLIKGE